MIYLLSYHTLTNVGCYWNNGIPCVPVLAIFPVSFTGCTGFDDKVINIFAGAIAYAHAEDVIHVLPEDIQFFVYLSYSYFCLLLLVCLFVSTFCVDNIVWFS